MARSRENAARWLAAARAGSTEALGQALQACRRYLLRVANRRLQPDLKAKVGASDLVQLTFLDAQRDFAHFEGASDEELLAWLRQILLHRLAHCQRDFRDAAKRDIGREVPLPTGESSAEGEGVPASDTPTPSERLIAGEDSAALRQALARMPEEYQAVIALRHQEGLTFEEMGRRLERSTSGARGLWLRAVERLQQELEASP